MSWKLDCLNLAGLPATGHFTKTRVKHLVIRNITISPGQYGGFLQYGYPLVIIHFSGIVHELNHLAIGVPPWLWKPLNIYKHLWYRWTICSTANCWSITYAFFCYFISIHPSSYGKITWRWHFLEKSHHRNGVNRHGNPIEIPWNPPISPLIVITISIIAAKITMSSSCSRRKPI